MAIFLSRGSTSTGTALHHASWRGQPEVIHLLCAARACVRVVDERGRTALHAAAGEGEGAACVALLSHGAQCEAECVLEATPSSKPSSKATRRAPLRCCSTAHARTSSTCSRWQRSERSSALMAKLL